MRRTSPTQLRVLVVVFSAVAALFLCAALFARFDRIVINGATIKANNPHFRHYMVVWRVGMGFGSLFSAFLACLCHGIVRDLDKKHGRTG